MGAGRRVNGPVVVAALAFGVAGCRADDTYFDAGGDGDAGGGISCPPDTCPAEMVYVPCGPFVMGSDPGEGFDDERPEHTVALSGYCIDRAEVTNAQWRSCVAAGGCRPPAGGPSSRTRADYHANPAFDDYPVINVDWDQATAYCARAGKRLPTEAEWEKAARGGCETIAPAACGIEDERTYPWGDSSPTCDIAGFFGCLRDTSGVGARSPAGDSPYGAQDMAGNVWEWVADWYDAACYATCASDCLDPAGPGSSVDGTRVQRGGSWSSDPGLLRAAHRVRSNPSNAADDVGLRCARTP